MAFPSIFQYTGGKYDLYMFNELQGLKVHTYYKEMQKVPIKIQDENQRYLSGKQQQ